MTPAPVFPLLQFQFVNSYLSLFYIGFYLKDMERLKEVRDPSSLQCDVMFPCQCSNSLGLQHLWPSLQSLNVLLSLPTCIDFHNHPPTRAPTHLYVCGRCCWCCLCYGVCSGRSGSMCCPPSSSRSRCLWSQFPGSSGLYSGPKYDPCPSVVWEKRSKVSPLSTVVLSRAWSGTVVFRVDVLIAFVWWRAQFMMSLFPKFNS